MDKQEILGIVRTITDGIRDSGMQYDYAMEARRCGDTALAEMHLLEMQKRLNGVQEWYKKTMSMMSNDIELDTLSEALIQDYMDRYRDLLRKFDSAKQ